MDNQHRQIKGYRDLSADEIARMNEIKYTGEELRLLIAEMRAQRELDPKWISIGETHLQQGIMALVRAVARPESF